VEQGCLRPCRRLHRAPARHICFWYKSRHLRSLTTYGIPFRRKSGERW